MIHIFKKELPRARVYFCYKNTHRKDERVEAKDTDELLEKVRKEHPEALFEITKEWINTGTFKMNLERIYVVI